ncbi:glucokinase regulatory protein isoform X3 [Nycticebus coucang]|uniref:glucokinase regulatory protein isoform X3 n=1 Tax=Nycticebus coucang TaxID=9470 RepID=UPI00234C666D|nr:glucokinase regulatory protein isoform X3 [Nycticebus coucang]
MPGTKRFQHVIETPEPGKWELSGYEAAVPITEKSNPLTQDLDKANAEKIVQLLGQCDAEIFQEEGQAMPTYQRLYSESILTTMVQVAGKVQEVLKEPDGGLVVLSGGGTSGRMAFLMSVSFNQLMKGLGQKPLYTYLIAGGDRNDPIEDWSSTFRQVAERMQKMQENQKAFVLNPAVGPEGLSGSSRMKGGSATKVLLETLLLAAHKTVDRGIAASQSTQSLLAQCCLDTPSLLLLPCLLPTEALTAQPDTVWFLSAPPPGSAELSFEGIMPPLPQIGVGWGEECTGFLRAHKAFLGADGFSPRCLLEILRTFERAHQVTYSQSLKIATLMKQVSTSLEKKGRTYLVGWQTLGIIAIMDGVECIHTFGADFQDIRGFLIGDHSDMFNQKAELTNQGPQFSFSQEDFLTSILPTLTEIDTVVFIFTLDDNLREVQTLVEQVKEKTTNIQALAHSTVGQSLPASLKKLFPSIISITWPLLFFEYEGNFIQKFQRELSTKWVLNTVSTGAHVLLGKILQNHMLDLRISNSKLFWRALAMLQRFSGQSKAQCIESLLQAIHFPQPLSDDIRAAPISCHVQVAHEKDQVIPVALLSLLFRCSISEAQAHLAAAPSVCEAVRSALAGPGQKRSADPQRS